MTPLYGIIVNRLKSMTDTHSQEFVKQLFLLLYMTLVLPVNNKALVIAVVIESR